MSNSHTSKQRYTGRLVIDPKMGDLYDWVSSMSGRARSRELLNLVRLGFYVSKGNLQFTVPVTAPVVSPIDAPMVDSDSTKTEIKADPEDEPINEAEFLKKQAADFNAEFFGMSFAPPDDLREQA